MYDYATIEELKAIRAVVMLDNTQAQEQCSMGGRGNEFWLMKCRGTAAQMSILNKMIAAKEKEATI